jgi:AraC-like DNA-binding protein
VFGCPVLFDRKNDYIVVGTGLGRIPILQPNAQLRELFEGHARSELERIDGDKATAAAATRIILDRLPRGRVTAGSVARELSMSVRTLQSRLREEGEVFSRLLEDMRISLAKRYLGDGYSVEEITLLLGFSEPSVFRRAFKKAAGMTPREYRETASPRSRPAG